MFFFLLPSAAEGDRCWFSCWGKVSITPCWSGLKAWRGLRGPGGRTADLPDKKHSPGELAASHSSLERASASARHLVSRDALVSQTQDHAREGRGGRTPRILGAGAAGSVALGLKAPHQSKRRGLSEVVGEGDPVSPLGRLRRIRFCAGIGALPPSSVSSSHSIRTSQRPQVKGHRARPAHWSPS